MICFRLKEDEKSWSAGFLFTISFPFYCVYLTSRMWVCVCLCMWGWFLQNLWLLAYAYMRIILVYFAIQAHLVDEMCMNFICLIVIKFPKKEPRKYVLLLQSLVWTRWRWWWWRKKERRATITSFPRGHYEIVQSNFTWPTINFVTKYHLFCGRAAEWVSKHFNERADKHCDAIVKLLTLTYASVVATLLILLYVTMYVEYTLVALDYMKHFIYLTHRTRFVWVVFSLTSQPN